MQIDAAIVRKVATLARLELSTDEVDYFESKLCEVVGYIEQIESLALDDCEETDTEEVTPERDDVVVASVDPRQLTEQAPKVSGTAFQVPRIIE